MAEGLSLSGANGIELGTIISDELKISKPTAVGIASAYVSMFGVRRLKGILSKYDGLECRLVAGIDGDVTHPSALNLAVDAGWKVRLGESTTGIFHPKLIIAGSQFKADDTLNGLNFVYLGSGNLTRGGLISNLETAFIIRNPALSIGSSESFATIWKSAQPATPAALSTYAVRFAETLKSRKAKDLELLGISEIPQTAAITPSALKQKLAPLESNEAIPTSVATTAWAGLQSFTGEYQFQVEFPKAAGKVIQAMVMSAGATTSVSIQCSDGAVRPMTFKFYQDNSMFRLNIPPATPGVTWARNNKDGIAVVSKMKGGAAQIQLQLLQPGVEANEVAAKSLALGTWGKTTTRTYGWY